MKVVVISILNIVIWIQISCEPCTNYKNLDSINDFTRSTANAGSYSLCDNTLTTGWYRVTSKAGEKMPTQCIIGGSRCGASYPIWMNGTYPSSNQIANVTACAASYSGDCCAYSYNIQVKNCTNYLVYHLVPVTFCYQAYCFGFELPCPTGQISDNGFSPGCEPDPCLSENYKVLEGEAKRSANYTLQNGDVAIEDSRLKTGWYIINSVTGNDILNYSVPMFHCGTLYPLWMKGSLPTKVNETVSRKVCRSGLYTNCDEEYSIRVRNCGTYRTYYLTQLNVDKSAYCFGTLPIDTPIRTSTPFYTQKSTSTTTKSTTSTRTTVKSTSASTSKPVSSTKTLDKTTKPPTVPSTTTATKPPTVSSTTKISTSKPTTDINGDGVLLPKTDKEDDVHIWIIITIVLGVTTTVLIVVVFVIYKRKYPGTCMGSQELKKQFDPPTYEEAVQKDTMQHIYDVTSPVYDEIDSNKMDSIRKHNNRY